MVQFLTKPYIDSVNIPLFQPSNQTVQTTAITAVVLTRNEEKNLPSCLESLAGFCPVYVLDSGSTDATLEIARAHGAQVFHHDFTNHGEQWAWALENLPFDSGWMLALDADYVVSDELKQKIVTELESLQQGINGIYVKYCYTFAGSRIRFGGTRHDRLQIVRLGFASIDISDMVDNRFVVEGETARWNQYIYEDNYYDNDISIWMAKQDKYAVRLAVEEELRRQGEIDWQGEPAFFGTPDQRVTWLRDRWLHLPLFLRPVLYYLYRYIFALGFLDGKGGFLYHLLQGLVLRIMVDWKIGQLRTAGVNGEKLLTFKQQMLKTRDGSVDKILALMQTPTE